MAATVLEQVAFQRAVLGVEEPVWHYGKFMGMRRRFSDGLLRLLILRGDLRARANLTAEEKVLAAQQAAHAAGGCFKSFDQQEVAEARLGRLIALFEERLDRDLLDDEPPPLPDRAERHKPGEPLAEPDAGADD